MNAGSMSMVLRDWLDGVVMLSLVRTSLNDGLDLHGEENASAYVCIAVANPLTSSTMCLLTCS